MPDQLPLYPPRLTAALQQLKTTLGDFLSRETAAGVFHAQVSGAGSVPELSDLLPPEIHLDVLPELTSQHQHRLETLGYRKSEGGWEHAGGWRLVLPDEGSGWRAEQEALTTYLLVNAAARACYRETFLKAGRTSADHCLSTAALEHHAQTVGFAPAAFVARLLGAPKLQPNVPWMFAAGMALDLHLGHTTRPHDDIDVIFARSAQANLADLLSDWRLDAVKDGQYHLWNTALQPPHFQIHARSPQLPQAILLDIMLTDFGADTWHYRRDPSLTLPLAEARRISAQGWPYLAPQAVLLFKSATGGRSTPRPKDQSDFERVAPILTSSERDWLRAALQQVSPGHL